MTASYGAIQALHGVNLEVNQGEIVVVLGANGAGKTTTLRAICNMVATDGNVMFNGNDISKSDTADIVNAGIAHVPQGRGTFAALTVLENLEVGAYTRTDDEVRSDIEMWFEKYPVLGERQTQAA
ncbi:MAG: ATP-binding cassette domain-containing protein, partial [Actinomycetota bacterium]|nr:ATP-binding cassette domain-containing protein [Actinomycetota bacterium]